MLAATAYMLWLSWWKWPDALIDFGKELYMPWQVLEGRVMYRDLDSYLGPLSPHVNAIWYALFGVSLRTLILVNFGQLALLAIMLYRLLLIVAARFAAGVAMTVFVVVFAFAHLSGYGNYNLVCPYTHEVLHGMLLAFTALTCFSLYLLRGRRLVYLLLAGLACGVASLGRPEPCLAGTSSILIALSLRAWHQREGWPRYLRGLASFALALVLPSLLAWISFSRVLPPRQAASGVFRGWLSALNPELVGLKMFQDAMGMSEPGRSLVALILWTVAYGFVFGLIAAVALTLRRFEDRLSIRLTVFVVTLAATAWTLFWIGGVPVAHGATRALPVAVGLASFVWLAVWWWRDKDERSLMRLTLCLFALALVGRVVLNTRVHHTGYANAMPVTLVWIVCLLDWIPRGLRRVGAAGSIFAAAALALVLVWAGNLHRISERAYALKNTPVAAGADAFVADQRGVAVQAALEEIQRRIAPDQTLAVLPEGSMLNFLSRRHNSTPYPIIMPTEIASFGEAAILEGFERHPPDFIILAHKDTSEFGYRFFGTDYAKSLASWIAGNYRPVWRIGSPPLIDERFGILLLERAGP